MFRSWVESEARRVESFLCNRREHLEYFWSSYGLVLSRVIIFRSLAIDFELFYVASDFWEIFMDH